MHLEFIITKKKNTKIMWINNLKKHFPCRRWKKHYKKIIFYIQCINVGLKPSFMWDFGPISVDPQQVADFLQDLKQSCLISEDIIVIEIDDITFIANTCHLSESLERNHLFMDITKSEKEWTLFKTSELLLDVIDRLKFIKKSSPRNIITLKLTEDDCIPSIFGLMLGYPLIYYFKDNYPRFPLSLVLYKAVCKFQFLDILGEFLISSFAIPKSLFNTDVESIVNEWVHNHRSINSVMFQNVKIECSNEYVNSLNL